MLMTAEQIAAERALITEATSNVAMAPWPARPSLRNYIGHWTHCVDVLEKLQEVQESLPAAIAEQLKVS